MQIALDKHTPERFTEFDKLINACPEVVECYLVTGQSADYNLKVVVKDMQAYQEFLLNTLTQIPGVSGVHSSFVMRKVVETTQLPLNHL